MRARIFNIGVLVGLALIAAGAWMVYGPGPAMLAVGLVVWVTTVVATHFALTKGGA